MELNEVALNHLLLPSPDGRMKKEEMDQEEGEIEDRPRVLRAKPKPKEGDPKKQFQL